LCTVSGSAAEPSPYAAADQMRAATERLRDKAWMVAPLTAPDAPEAPASGHPAETAPVAEA
jgi:hypothetical protein